jgi:formylglycine-generating enzyme required for sulfatase activity
MRRWGCVGLLLSVLGWPILLYGAIFETQHMGVIVGELTTPLSMAVALGGVFTVPPQEIVSLVGERLTLTDGTVLQGRMATETLAVNTSAGQVIQIPVAELKTIHGGRETTVVPVTHGAIFELHSGEVIVGEARLPLTIQLSFGGKVEVPPRELVSFVDRHFTLRDGSLLTGRLSQETVLITTRFGELQVPSGALKAIRAAPVVRSGSEPADAMPAQGTPTGGLSSGPSALGGATFINSIGMVFVLIPAGEFMMGSHDGDYDERPVHQVRLSQPFYLGKYEVTQGQWQAVMGRNPSHFTGDPNLPVEQVSWEEVQTFVRALNVKEGVTVYRLPTEAEWEYAARAGSTTTYSFGNKASKLGDYAWYGDNAEGRTHPVGQRKPNAWGLYDMHGNVWEWVQDWYGPYDVDEVTDPPGPSEDSYRIYRGGGWGTFAGNCRSSERNFDTPDTRLAGLGFRLLRAAP